MSWPYPSRVLTYLTHAQLKEGMAYHEAGHAVAGSLWGFAVAPRIFEVPFPDAEFGIGYTGETPYSGRVRWAVAVAHTAEAGNIANQLHLQRTGLWTEDLAVLVSSDHDRLIAVDTLAEVGFTMHHGRDAPAESLGADGASWEAVSEQVRRALCRLWPQVEEVAADLVMSGSASAERVREIIHGAALHLDLDEMARASASGPGRPGAVMPRNP
ncbi:hypothetical protein [Streptomyces luteireticuli]|uniref:hypothetical protein n=1 Tax=Streptomyces luteireticuli TaxID=173858 RepID=UPI00355791D0